MANKKLGSFIRIKIRRANKERWNAEFTVHDLYDKEYIKRTMSYILNKHGRLTPASYQLSIKIHDAKSEGNHTWVIAWEGILERAEEYISEYTRITKRVLNKKETQVHLIKK